MKIGNDIYYVGVNDHQVDLFEGQYVVPNGMSYNSYVIMDEKIAVMDTVDAVIIAESLENMARRFRNFSKLLLHWIFRQSVRCMDRF